MPHQVLVQIFHSFMASGRRTLHWWTWSWEFEILWPVTFNRPLSWCSNQAFKIHLWDQTAEKLKWERYNSVSTSLCPQTRLCNDENGPFCGGHRSESRTATHWAAYGGSPAVTLSSVGRLTGVEPREDPSRQSAPANLKIVFQFITVMEKASCGAVCLLSECACVLTTMVQNLTVTKCMLHILTYWYHTVNISHFSLSSLRRLTTYCFDPLFSSRGLCLWCTPPRNDFLAFLWSLLADRNDKELPSCNASQRKPMFSPPGWEEPIYYSRLLSGLGWGMSSLVPSSCRQFAAVSPDWNLMDSLFFCHLAQKYVQRCK